jgi:isopenicillin N synthase-like dioxygenase
LDSNPVQSSIPPAAGSKRAIPTLDLGAYLAGGDGAAEQLAETLRYTQENVGFYVVVNHGVPRETIDHGYAELAKFFALRDEEKLRIRINDKTVGYIPPRSTMYVSATVHKNTKKDLNETITLARERPVDDPAIRAGIRFVGPNQWPPGRPEFRQAMIDYQNAIAKLGYAMLPLYARALELPPDYFAPFFTEPMWWTRNSHYAAIEPEDNQFGIAPHCDHSFITLLPISEVSGLEVMWPDGEWVRVDPVENGVVINTGEFLARWTNGRFLATPHRVIMPKRDRYSMAMFFNPNYDTMAVPLPTCVTADRPVAYEPVSMLQYMSWYMDTNYRREGGGQQQ